MCVYMWCSVARPPPSMVTPRSLILLPSASLCVVRAGLARFVFPRGPLVGLGGPSPPCGVVGFGLFDPLPPSPPCGVVWWLWWWVVGFRFSG